MGEIVCIGLDLAWSSRNLTGGAVIVDGVLREARADLRGNATIVEWIGGWLDAGKSAVIAVDAPLCVPNMEGKRLCETLLGNQWRSFQAGPYPANRQRFADIGIRGEEVVGLLNQAYGFVEAAPIVPTEGGRFICEVYPHPAHVSLFNLQKILKYKRKSGRTYKACWAELDRYQGLLRTLSTYDPPLQYSEEFLNASFVGVKGQRLKALEDALDAVTCAYVAAYLWRHGPAGVWVYGTVADGHIIVPRYPLEAD
jgi:predicted RNase H-like nuclease